MWERLGLLLAVAGLMAGPALLSALRLTLGFVGRWLLRALNVLAALLVLFAEWGWRPLAALLGQLSRLRVVARLEAWVGGLPPYGALAAFLLPSLFLVPLKLVAVYLLAHGQKGSAVALLVFAKVAGTAIVARLFLLTESKLMRIGWFARAYNRLMPWKEALFARIRASWAWRYGRMLKSKVRQTARRAWTRWRPTLAATIGPLLANVRTRLRLLFRRGPKADGVSH